MVYTYTYLFIHTCNYTCACVELRSFVLSRNMDDCSSASFASHAWRSRVFHGVRDLTPWDPCISAGYCFLWFGNMKEAMEVHRASWRVVRRRHLGMRLQRPCRGACLEAAYMGLGCKLSGWCNRSKAEGLRFRGWGFSHKLSEWLQFQVCCVFLLRLSCKCP